LSVVDGNVEVGSDLGSISLQVLVHWEWEENSSGIGSSKHSIPHVGVEVHVVGKLIQTSKIDVVSLL